MSRQPLVAFGCLIGLLGIGWLPAPAGRTNTVRGDNTTPVSRAAEGIVRDPVDRGRETAHHAASAAVRHVSWSASLGRARVAIEPGVHYVGQAISVTVSVSAERVRPEIVLPELAPADGFLVQDGTDFRPVVTSSIGNVVDESNRFTYRFRLVGRRAGTLRLAPFQLRIGDRAASTQAMRVELRKVPEIGRPRTFLGGVGAVDVKADARPSSVRVGQVLEYTVTLNGPGALGSFQSPDWSRLKGVAIEPRLEELPNETPSGALERQFRCRIRPMKAGETALPPIVVSWFDPKTRRYMTRASNRVVIRVSDVARFDPSHVVYSAPNPRAHTRWLIVVLVIVGTSAFVIAFGAQVWARWQRRRAHHYPSKLLARLMRELDVRRAPDVLGKTIHDGLVAYLAAVSGRPPGVLTPEEARASVSQVTREPAGGDAAARLIAACDRAQFSGRTQPYGGDVSSDVLVRGARDLYAKLVLAREDEANAVRNGRGEAKGVS